MSVDIDHDEHIGLSVRLSNPRELKQNKNYIVILH